MSVVETRMPRPEAIAIAKAFVAEIEDCTDRLIVAGSLRRRLAMIGDIEIVCVPKIVLDGGDMFGDRPVGVNLLEGRMQALLEHGVVARRLDRNGVPRWGPRLKYLLYRGARVDLFSPNGEQVGWHVALRTGPAAFSRQLVVERGRKTKDGRPGLLPPLLAPRDGYLTRRISGERLSTPEERDVFSLFGLAYQEPSERS